MRPPKGLGIKIDVWENPIVYATTPDWSSLYGTMRVESETACFLMFLLALQVSLGALTDSGCFSSTCIVVGAVNFTVTPVENFVSPLSESSPSSRKHKKKSMSLHDSQFIHGERSPKLSSSFFLLLTLRSTEWKWTAFDRRRGITAAGGLGAS